MSNPHPATPLKECDLILKGGVTSGVVYPKAIVELSKHYRFRGVGGASAGAIAAAFAAAAELGRDTEGGGFDRLAKLPKDMASRLGSLFQPAPALRPLLDAALAAREKSFDERTKQWKSPDALRMVARALPMLLGAWPGAASSGFGVAALVALPWLLGAGWGIFVAAALAGVVVTLVCLAARIRRVVVTELPKHGFGVCPGVRQEGREEPGLSDWIADTLDELAFGACGRDRPLTFGDLKAAQIDFVAMTTHLGEGRPYRLPFDQRRFAFCPRELRRVLPKRVVAAMMECARPAKGANALFMLPDTDRLPVAFAVRMSLSFPGLVSAVKLMVRDFTDTPKGKSPGWIPAWFSDGGICANFPVHFFDNLWPTRPTFGITLERRLRQGEEAVKLPKDASSGIQLRVRPLGGIGDFVSAILDTMQEWRDNLRSTQSGFRERIVRVRLSPDEGGLNLTMPPPLVMQLCGRGKDAGKKLVETFDWDTHRWKRYLVSMGSLDEALQSLVHAHDTASPGTDSFDSFLQRYDSSRGPYRRSRRWRDSASKATAMLLDLGRNPPWTGALRTRSKPRPATEIRIHVKE